MYLRNIKNWNKAGLKASLVVQTVKSLPAVWKTQVRSLGQKDPLEKEIAAHSSTLAVAKSQTQLRDFTFLSNQTKLV